MNGLPNINPNQLSQKEIELMKMYSMKNKQQSSLVDQLFSQPNTNNNMGGGTSIADLQKMKPLTQPSQPQPPQHYLPPQNPQDNYDRNKIRFLVNNLNRSLEDFEPSKYNDSEDSEIETETESKHEKKSRSILMYYLKEPLLLILIYVIMSQGFVKKSIGNYISYVNPSDSGYISLIGYLIYGTILTILFLFFRKIIIK